MNADTSAGWSADLSRRDTLLGLMAAGVVDGALSAQAVGNFSIVNARPEQAT